MVAQMYLTRQVSVQRMACFSVFLALPTATVKAMATQAIKVSDQGQPATLLCRSTTAGPQYLCASIDAEPVWLKHAPEGSDLCVWPSMAETGAYINILQLKEPPVESALA